MRKSRGNDRQTKDEEVKVWNFTFHILVTFLAKSRVCDQEGKQWDPPASFNFPSWLYCLRPSNKVSPNTVLYACNTPLALLPTRSKPRTILSLDRNRLHNETSCHRHIGPDSIVPVSLLLPLFFWRGTIIAVWPIRQRTRSYLKALVRPSESATVWNQVSLQQPVRLHGNVH